MKTPNSHKTFLAKKNYPLELFDPSCLDHEQVEAVMRYGYWFEALAEGKIEPITEDQKHFTAVAKHEAEPDSFYEVAWDRLMERRKFESDDTPHYEVSDSKQDWFDDRGCWVNR